MIEKGEREEISEDIGRIQEDADTFARHWFILFISGTIAFASTALFIFIDIA